MAKKSRRQQTKEAQQIAWYKWEFLRRNSEYRKDYEGFIQEFGGWFGKHGYWYDQEIAPWGGDNLRYFAAVIAPKARVICEKWGIRDPFSPDWQFARSGLYSYKPSYEVFLPTDCSNESAGESWDLSDFLMSKEELLKNLPVPEWPRREHHLVLAFDLRRPLPSLLREAEGRITSHKKHYGRRHPQPGRTTPAVRRRLDLYDRYLRVWELRERQGEKFEVIGALEFPGKPRGAQHAIDSFQRAQELIEGGYKEWLYSTICG